MSKHVISSALLVLGVALVFAGLSAALGFTLGGTITSVAAIVVLFYAGAVWFGRATPPPVLPGPADPVIVFDRGLRVVCGSARGTSLVAQFPETQHAEVRGSCAAALAGDSGRFTCRYGPAEIAFDAVPVRAGDGSIVYGMLLRGLATAELLASAPSAMQRAKPAPDGELRAPSLQL